MIAATPAYWVLAGIFLNFLVFGLPAGLLLDRLLRHEYENHPSDWEADGRPSGFLWCPRDADWWYASTFNSYLYRWFFKTPEWIRQSPLCLRHLNLIRALIVCGMMFGVILVFTQFI